MAASQVMGTGVPQWPSDEATKGRGKNNYQVFVVIHLLQG